MSKNNVRFVKRLDSAYFYGIFFTIFYIIEKFVSEKDIIKTLFCFLLVSTSYYFLWSMFMIKNVKAKNLRVDNSFDEISLVLYENAMYIAEKVGDYYVFKTRNFIIPNVRIFVKEYDKYCKILLYSKDAVWLEESLKNIKL